MIERCTSLEEWQFIGEAISKMCHNVKLSNYQSFCISDGSTYHFSGKLRERNSLDIFMADEVFSIETFKNLAQNAEFLHLKGLGRVWKNMIPEIICSDDKGTTNLVDITLHEISTLRCLIDNTDSRVQNALSKLELLRNLESVVISNCIHLEGTLFKT